MKVLPFSDYDLDIARTRIVLSLLAMLSLYIDPTTAGGLFHLTFYVLATLLSHLVYSVGTYFLLESQMGKNWLPTATTLLDLLFAMAIAYLTEGQTGPSYVFFVFAIIAVGVRATLRAIIHVTLLGVALYLVVISANNRLTGAYVMRAVYLAIAPRVVAPGTRGRRLAGVGRAADRSETAIRRGARIRALAGRSRLELDAPHCGYLGRSGNQNKWRVRRQQPAERTHPPDNA